MLGKLWSRWPYGRRISESAQLVLGCVLADVGAFRKHSMLHFCGMAFLLRTRIGDVANTRGVLSLRAFRCDAGRN